MMEFVGEVSLIPSIGIHHIDVRFSFIPTRSKSNAFAVWRPRGVVIKKVIVREVLRIPSIGIHHVDLRVPSCKGPNPSRSKGQCVYRLETMKDANHSDDF